MQKFLGKLEWRSPNGEIVWKNFKVDGLEPGAARIASENESDQPDGKSLFRLLLEVEAELRKMVREDNRVLRGKLPIIARKKSRTQPRGAERLSRYIE